MLLAFWWQGGLIFVFAFGFWETDCLEEEHCVLLVASVVLRFSITLHYLLTELSPCEWGCLGHVRSVTCFHISIPDLRNLRLDQSASDYDGLMLDSCGILLEGIKLGKFFSFFPSTAYYQLQRQKRKRMNWVMLFSDLISKVIIRAMWLSRSQKPVRFYLSEFSSGPTTFHQSKYFWYLYVRRIALCMTRVSCRW